MVSFQYNKDKEGNVIYPRVFEGKDILLKLYPTKESLPKQDVNNRVRENEIWVIENDEKYEYEDIIKKYY